MWSVTACGWEIMITCEPSTSMMSAPSPPGHGPDEVGPRGLVAGGDDRPGRQLPPGRRSGGIAERRGGDGALGRGHQRGGLRGQVGGEGLPEQRRVDPELDRGLAVPPGGIVVRDQGRVQDAVFGLGRDLAQAFAFIGGEGGDEDQADDVRGAGRGVADDRAAVGVPGQQHRAVDLAEQAGGVGRIGGHAAQRVGGGDDGVALPLQPLDDAVPAGTVGERAVHQHDRRFGVGVLGPLACRVHG
jgi:hypothetical protein